MSDKQMLPLVSAMSPSLSGDDTLLSLQTSNKAQHPQPSKLQHFLFPLVHPSPLVYLAAISMTTSSDLNQSVNLLPLRHSNFPGDKGAGKLSPTALHPQPTTPSFKPSLILPERPL